MCGIAGYVSNDAPASAEVLGAMLAGVRHRGPDDTGVELLGPCGLAHARLAILDLSDAGHQPMSTPDGRYWVTYNGEVYNFREVARELEGRGVTLRSQCDTEVVLEAWRLWGPAALDRFNGMFAFALWDTDERVLVLARDRLGKKPLYYACDGPRLAFGSELKPVLAAPWVERELDRGAVAEYFAHNTIAAPRTPFRHVRALEPGCWARFDGRGLRVERWWDLRFDVKERRSVPEWSARLRRLLDASVRRRLVSDVPVGAFLSGGLDSSVIAALMRSHYGGPFATFCLGFEESSYDERPAARLVARHLGTEHHEVVCRPEDFAARYQAIARHADCLTADVSMVPMRKLAELAAAHVKVVLSGDGGDELFAGYLTYQAVLAARLYRRLPRPLRRAVEGLITRLPASGAKQSLDFKLRQFVNAAGRSPGAAQGAWRMIFGDTERAELLGDWAPGESATCAYEETWASALADSELDKAFYTDVHRFLPDSILRKVDTMTMSCGLEARAPLLDFELAEATARIPATVKMPRGRIKWLFKQMAHELVPPAIRKRPKAGFQSPYAAWFRGPLRELVEDVLTPAALRQSVPLDVGLVERLKREHASGRANHAFKLWSLLNFVAWDEGIHRAPAPAARAAKAQRASAPTHPKEPRP